MAHLVQKIVRFDNDFLGVWTTTPSGFSAERVWDCPQYFAVPLLCSAHWRLVTGRLMCSGCISIDKEIKNLLVCVCVVVFIFSLLEESHSWAPVLPV